MFTYIYRNVCASLVQASKHIIKCDAI